MPLRNISAAEWNGTIVRSPGPTVSLTKTNGSAAAQLAMSGPGKVVYHERNYAAFAKEGYKENTEAYACVNIIATAIKGIKFNVYKRTGKAGKRSTVNDGPYVDLLNRPNPQMSKEAFFEAWVIYLMTAGNVYMERASRNGPDGTDTKAPLQLWLQRPDRMEIIKGTPANPIQGYRYRTGGLDSQSKPWLPDMIRRQGVLQNVQKILHSKFFDPVGDWYGLSPMEVAGRSIDQNNAAQDWNVALLQNGARPSGLLTIEGIDEETRQRVDDEFAAKHGGPRNVGKTIIASGGEMKYESFSQTAQEMAWLEGQELATRRICSVYKVPIELIGDGKSRTYSNYEEARKALYMECVLPLTDYLCGEMNYWLSPFFGEGIEIGYDKNDIEALQEDRRYIHERAIKCVTQGIMTPNMALKVMGEDLLPPEVGDVLYVPSNTMPVPINGKTPGKFLGPAAGQPHPALPVPPRIPGVAPTPLRPPGSSAPKPVPVPRRA